MTLINKSGLFYPIYKSANESFSTETFQCAEDTVQALMGSTTSSDHPGMLLGKVQSGKTRTFISVLALAFDNGFDIAIILSKNSRALIEQTCKRVRGEFATFVSDGELEIYDIMHAPDRFSRFELDSKLILVAKKQTDNLNRLIMLFTENPAMSGKQILIIDDEADSASIGYAKKAGVVEARTIALQISKLRTVIPQSSFLQVTATPYSLYLQPTDIEVANVLTFQPTRPAFTKLVPVPGDYVGGETYFGEAAQSEDDTLQSLIHHTVDHNEFVRLKKEDRRMFKVEDVLTTDKLEGFRTAIVNFIVGGTIQRIISMAAGAKEKKLRYSFLVHSEAGREAHSWQETITRTLVEKLHIAATKGDAIFVSLVTAAHEDLKRSLELDGKTVPPLAQVLTETADALRDEHVSIIKVNSDDDVASQLDETGQLKLRSPLNVFVGGQVLDRGVTLANLIGFYYGRRPNKFQQDTVLQHSRMYGYRRPDLAVTRFYTSRAIRYAMEQMEEFDSSLRTTVEAGGDKAVQFIRKAADGTIIPCSPNKILVATTKSLRPGKRILPIGFHSGYRSGANGIGQMIQALDIKVNILCGFDADGPVLVELKVAIGLLNEIEPTLEFEHDETPDFDWDGARAALTHLCHQAANPVDRGKVWLWAAKDRNSSRLASASSHATFIETPDSEKTEGRMAKQFAISQPIMFLLRQNGLAANGWRDTPFYWPVIRAQQTTPTAIYTAQIVGGN